MERSPSRPSFRTLVIVLFLVAAIVVVGVVADQGLLASLVTMLICAAVIGWWIWRNRSTNK